MIQRTYETPGELRLEIRIPSGRVDVETHDGTQTEVELLADREDALEHAVVELRERGGGHELVVDVERKKGGGLSAFGINIDIDLGFRSPNYRLHVRCPHGVDARFKTASAEVQAKGRLRTVEANTASGDLTLEDVEGKLAIKTASGDVKLHHARSDVRIQTVSGDVYVERVDGDATFQVVSGDVRVDDAGGAVTAKSVSGDVALGAVVEGDVTLNAVSGDLHVGVRRGSRVYVDATSVSGSMESELELGDEPPSSDGPMVELRARTVSGDVELVRAPARENQPA
jgi:Putative adhesin